MIFDLRKVIYFWISFDWVIGRIILYCRMTICSIFRRDRRMHCINFLHCIIYGIFRIVSGNRRDILNIQAM